MVGMARRTEFLHQDPSLVGGAPTQLSSSIVAPPVLAPIGPGGTNALLVATADGTVHAYGSNGQDLPGWPVQTAPDTGYHPGETAYTSQAVPTYPAGRSSAAWPSGTWPTPRDATSTSWPPTSPGGCGPGTPQGQLLPGLAGADRRRLLRARGGQHRQRGAAGHPRARRCSATCRATGPSTWWRPSMDRHVYAWQPDGQAGAGLAGRGGGPERGPVGRPVQRPGDLPARRRRRHRDQAGRHAGHRPAGARAGHPRWWSPRTSSTPAPPTPRSGPWARSSR